MHAHCSDKRTHARLAVPQWSQDTSRGEKSCYRGFTLIELLTVIAIIFTLVAIGYPIYGTALERAKVARAIADIRVVSAGISEYQLFNGGLPLSLADIGRTNFLDPYGNPYEYLEIACEETKGKCKAPKGARRDKFLKPLNSDFDLYSKGSNGQSKAQLNGKDSGDDILRAVDGGFIGLASEF